MIKNYEIIKDHKALKIVYMILATSGIRYVECIDFLRTFDKNKFIVNDKYASYNVSELRHTKNVNNIYIPKFVYDQLSSFPNSYHSLRVRMTKKGAIFSLKYLRKWNYNFLLYNNVPESVADFIQGRVNKTIAGNHYLAKSQQANFWYEKVTDKLKELF
jgi:intergrase/recombinase